ncbi:BSD domain-containing protein 1-like isoform X1 [Onthophagus taurus]|uniref:BSD domain-containing protein 1-like isoform X1 n=1 Tax=Onthophagus taurus TaxID=166361 RepID=UPI000C209E01|nr:BSD domain-containing protein 1-like isoform X1 [Onthophagus taurus]
MAESNDSWFGSWLNAAKNKSTEVLEFVKKDLGELGQAVKTEATNMVSSTGSVLEKTLRLNEPESTANTVKKSISSFLGQVNEALNPSPEDEDTEAILITDGDMVPLTKLQCAIYDLQKKSSTFLTDPDSSLEKRYQCWLEIIDDQLTEYKLNKHLANSVVLSEQYSKLVPDHVSHDIFWQRYLFKKALLEDDIALQDDIEKRREIKGEEIIEVTDEDSVKWEQEDFAHDVELTEEEQIRLLEEYEQETKMKRKNSDLKLEEKTSPNKENDKKIDNESIMSVVTNSSNSSTDDDWEKIEK